MIWVPPSLVVCLLLARVAELYHRFPANAGRVESPWTFHLLTMIGGFTAIGCLAEYFVVARPPNGVALACGVLLAAGAFALRAWARQSLGRMWSVHIEIREQHTIVTEGPYAFIRHPIYVAAFAELAGIPIALRSWITGAIGLTVYAIVLVVRTRLEEAAMADRCGDGWRDYCARTGAFIPRRW